jgi:hypothetical protein
VLSHPSEPSPEYISESLDGIVARFLTRVAIILIAAAMMVAALATNRTPTTNHVSQVPTPTYAIEAHRLTSTPAPHRDGGLVFRLYVVKYLTTVDPGERYCVVMLDAENVSSGPVIFDTVYQAAYDAAGNRYSPTPISRVGINPETDTYIVVPEGIAAAALWFLIPSDAELVAVELHESDHSSGVRVNI